jgi:hypothetical protein
MTGASGLLADTANLLSGLELADLPPLHNLTFSYSLTDRAWQISAQLGPIGDEAAQIDAVRTWAAALDARTRLDQPFASSTGYSFRTLEAVKDLEYGVSLHIWTHIDTTFPAPELAAA